MVRVVGLTSGVDVRLGREGSDLVVGIVLRDLGDTKTTMVPITRFYCKVVERTDRKQRPVILTSINFG